MEWLLVHIEEKVQHFQGDQLEFQQELELILFDIEVEVILTYEQFEFALVGLEHEQNIFPS